ncbi:hypothetical protein B7463_g8557, partial [Scytalidium lignicola]
MGGLEVKKMVLEKDSSILGYPGEILKALHADHHNVCKFERAQDSNYISVRNALKTLVERFRSTGQRLLGTQGRSQLQHLEELLAASENQNEDLEFFQKRWTPGTCEWILSSSQFQKWISESSSPSFLWLYALPANGKSVLSSFIINHLLRESSCVYYFSRFGDHSKRSLSACLRSLAFQIAQQLPLFHRALNDMRFSTTTLEKIDPKVIWEKIFHVLFSMRFHTTMYWVIDALDESNHPQLLVQLMHTMSNSPAPIKVLLDSRRTPELISTFDRLAVNARVIYIPIEDTKRDILDGAGGNFLWASLAVIEIMKCNSQEDLDETLAGIPHGMQQLYQRMESSILNTSKPRDRLLAKTVLTWAVCSRRPLMLDELSQALKPEFAVLLELRFAISRYGLLPQSVSVKGISNTIWDDNLAKLSLGPETQTLTIICSGGHFAVFTAAGQIVIYNSLTFEAKHTLRHEERVSIMDFSHCSNFLVLYGFQSTKVWSDKTGEVLYRIETPAGSRALTIKFSPDSAILYIGSTDRVVRVAHLRSNTPTRSVLNEGLLKDDTTLGRHVNNVPYCIAFDATVTYLAVGYRGSPLSIWETDPSELINRFKRNQEYAGNSWTVVDQILWQPQSSELLGLYMGGHVFKWNPHDDIRRKIDAGASIVASSSEGKLFATGDNLGMIKLYNFQHFALIYQLSCESMVYAI